MGSGRWVLDGHPSPTVARTQNSGPEGRREGGLFAGLKPGAFAAILLRRIRMSVFSIEKWDESRQGKKKPSGAKALTFLGSFGTTESRALTRCVAGLKKRRAARESRVSKSRPGPARRLNSFRIESCPIQTRSYFGRSQTRTRFWIPSSTRPWVAVMMSRLPSRRKGRGWAEPT